ncbi:MAG: T9SS type A sorting domain-containing protein [Dysgonamonadaceae bacterium]|jgi:hypothetical protein|nr:T9SS type A sorting domain-containing protein [Dysgonamonadaceae bacterium]
MKQLFYRLGAAVLALLCGNQLFADDLTTVQAVPANDFLNSIGVNTSINTRGESYIRTKECAEYLGFRWIRAGAPSYFWQFKELYDEFHIRFSCSLGTVNDIDATVRGGREIVEIAPDALIAFEGCNEPNNWGIIYNGEKAGGFPEGSYPYLPLAKYMRDFCKAVKADPVVKDYPVWSVTDAGGAQYPNVGLQFLTVPEGVERNGDKGLDPEIKEGDVLADVACVHNYFSGLSPNTNNQTWRASNRMDANSLKSNFGLTWNKGYKGYSDEELMQLRCVTTETGTTISERVTEEYQGLTYLSCYLAQFAQGFEYTAMYIMRDRTDEGGNQTFGFYAGNYKPRLAAHYLHNLTGVLADYPSIENPGELAYSYSSKPVTVHDLLLQKNDGTFFLVVWGEKYLPQAVAEDVTITFEESVEKINVYMPAQYDDNDPGKGVMPVRSETGNVITLSMLNRPYILEINPKGTGIDVVKTGLNSSSAVYVYDNRLHVSGAPELTKVDIYDLTGKNVFQQTNRTEISDFDIARLPKGSYVVRLTQTGNRVENHRIVRY